MNMERCIARPKILALFLVLSPMLFSCLLPEQAQVLEKPEKAQTVKAKSQQKKVFKFSKDSLVKSKKEKLEQQDESDYQMEVFKRKRLEKEKAAKEKQKQLHNSALAYSQECHNNQELFDYRFCQDADPIVNLLKTANKVDLRIDSLYCSMRILVNSSKSCEYIRDCSLNSLLESLELYATSYFESDDEKQAKKKAFKAVEKTVYDFMSDGSDLALSSPGTFASSLSSKVVKIAEKNLKSSQKKEWQDRLRSLILRLLESSISKTLWDSQDHQGIWDSVMTTANGLYQLSKILVHMDDLDDLYWQFCRRLIWFFDFSAGQLPTSFYEGVEESIKDGSAFFLELPEQDEGITTKKEFLLEAVKKAKSQAIQPEFFSQEGTAKLSLSTPEIKSSPLVAPLESLFEAEAAPVKKAPVLAKKKAAEPKVSEKQEVSA